MGAIFGYMTEYSTVLYSYVPMMVGGWKDDTGSMILRLLILRHGLEEKLKIGTGITGAGDAL